MLLRDDIYVCMCWLIFKLRSDSFKDEKYETRNFYSILFYFSSIPAKINPLFFYNILYHVIINMLCKFINIIFLFNFSFLN